MANFQMRGSGWRFKTTEKQDINTIKYKPLKGSSYIPLPDELANTKAIINMKNKDKECFKRCVTRALNPRALNPIDIHPERITKDPQKQAEQLNWNDIMFPVTLKETDIFEKNNNSISVNVFGYKNCVYPLQLSKHYQQETIIDLLLISDNNTNHYV